MYKSWAVDGAKSLLCAVAVAMTQMAWGLSLESETAPGTRVWIGDHSLHLHCQGSGSPVVVFESGLGGTALDWSRVQPDVAKFTKACSYDRAGYGFSGPGPRPRNSVRIVRELNKLLGYGGAAPPYVLVGHSFGGLSVSLYARSFPNKTAGMVLVDAAHEEQFRRFERANVGPLLPRSSRFIIGNHLQVSKHLPDHLQILARHLAAQPAAVASLYSELRHFRTSAAQVRAAHPMPHVPLVVITHRIDENADPTALDREWLGLQKDLAALSSRGRLVMAQTDEHYIQLRTPEVVVEAIRAVIEETRASE